MVYPAGRSSANRLYSFLTQVSRAKNLVLNHPQEWQDLPDLPQGRDGHACLATQAPSPPLPYCKSRV